ncbi:MAG: chemotaxis protein CheD [Alphaproteobacteria bacterium]
MTRLGLPSTDELTQVHLFPGEIACRQEPQVITTILGSCVAVCLWDRSRCFGGMNHFVLPCWEHRDEPSLRYGNIAVEALVHRMLDLGARPEDLRAKVFGGANVLPTSGESRTVGSRNIEMALQELHRLGIPVVNRHVSGNNGILIKQYTETGEVWLRLVKNSYGPRA